jgi:hypothetical protein
MSEQQDENYRVAFDTLQLSPSQRQATEVLARVEELHQPTPLVYA